MAAIKFQQVPMVASSATELPSKSLCDDHLRMGRIQFATAEDAVLVVEDGGFQRAFL
jgi:hypothetical protein